MLPGSGHVEKLGDVAKSERPWRLCAPGAQRARLDPLDGRGASGQRQHTGPPAAGGQTRQVGCRSLGPHAAEATHAPEKGAKCSGENRGMTTDFLGKYEVLDS